MDVSIFLSQFFGVLLIVKGIFLLIKRKDMPAMIRGLTSNVATLSVIGLWTFGMGLLLVLFHNVWESSWRVILTILGWTVLLKGLALAFMPNVMMSWAGFWNRQSTLVVAGIITLIIGIYLAYQGFGFSY